MNNTTDVPPILDAVFVLEPNFWMIFPFMILIVTTCVANGLVILVTTMDRKLKGVTYTYVTSLAAADFLVGFIVMSGMMVYTVYDHWPLNTWLCTIWQVFDFAMCSVSILHLCLIAFDRFLATVHPMSSYLQHPDMKIRKARLKIVAAWVVGIAVWLPAIIIIRDQQLKEEAIPDHDCLFLPPKAYNLVQAIVAYYLPILVMLYFYGRVVLALYKRQKNQKNIQKHLVNAHVSPKEASNFSTGINTPHALSQEIPPRTTALDETPKTRTSQDNKEQVKSLDVERNGSCSKQPDISIKKSRRLSFSLRSWKLSSTERHPQDKEKNLDTSVILNIAHVNPAFENNTEQQANGGIMKQTYLPFTENETDEREEKEAISSYKLADDVFPRRTNTFCYGQGNDSKYRKNMHGHGVVSHHMSFSSKASPGCENISSISNYESITKNDKRRGSNRKYSTEKEDQEILIRLNGREAPEHYDNAVMLNVDVTFSDTTVRCNQNGSKVSPGKERFKMETETRDEDCIATEDVKLSFIKVPPKRKYLEMSVPYTSKLYPNSQVRAQNRQQIMHKRITQTLGIIILVFLICWLPFCIAWPINAFCECVNVHFYDFTYWAAYINSTLNPILYFLINSDFREALRRIATKCLSRQPQNSTERDIGSYA